MHTRCRGARGASSALFCLLTLLIAGTAAAERTGTPRLARPRSFDVPVPDSGLHASAPVTTLVLGSWSFGTTSCSGEGWTSVDLTAGDTNFGDFAGVLSFRTQATSELCIDNLTCLWGFLNGSTDHYGCGGNANQLVVPFGDAQRGYIWNEIQSPVMTLLGAGSSLALRFSVYRDLRFNNLVFYTWRVRSFHAGAPGEWKSNGALYYGPTVARADWIVEEEQIGALIDAGADQIQVALGVVDMAGVWGGIRARSNCHSNAPCFDTVKVLRVANFGPQWSVDCADLFQDNFATGGDATGTVRMDMARDVQLQANSTQPGDTIVVSVNEPTVGLGTDAAGGPAVYLHVREIPGKSGAGISGDVARWPVKTSGGGWTTLRFDSVHTTQGAVPGRYCVDLNDNLYTPGDSVLFYFSARDAAGHVTYWTEFIGTTTSETDARTYAMEATCLPLQNHNKIAILYVDDTDGSGAQPYFDGAFLQLGITADVDRYDVRAADEMVGNGPGSRVRDVAAQLVPYYDTIIWSSGVNTAGTIGDGSGAPEKSNDAAMLAKFLQDQPRGILYINGDHVAAELKQLSSASANTLKGYIGYDVVSEFHSPTTAISPQVISTPASAFTHLGMPDHFVAFGGCAQLNSFGLLAPSGTSFTEMTYGATVYAAEVSQVTNERWVLMSGFGFEFIRNDELDGFDDRARHLGDILASRELIGPCSNSTASIEPEDAGAKITWETSNCGHEVRIIRTADWAGSNEVIHVAAVPPSTGEFHDPMPFGGTAYYRLEELGARGVVVYSKSAYVTRNTAISTFNATARDLGIDVRWELVDRTGIESMRLDKRLRGTLAFFPASDDSVLAASASGYFDRVFIPGSSYEYRLTIHYAEGLRSRSEVVAVTAPHEATLGQNVPNPFNPETRIPFVLSYAGRVDVDIFDIGGAHVRKVFGGEQSAGYHEVPWDGRNDAGSAAASGVYFCRMNAQGRAFTRKIVLVR
jgi:FlgD Ig-like domain